MEMGKVGEHGVNLRRAEALGKIARRVGAGRDGLRAGAERDRQCPTLDARHILSGSFLWPRGWPAPLWTTAQCRLAFIRADFCRRSGGAMAAALAYSAGSRTFFWWQAWSALFPRSSPGPADGCSGSGHLEVAMLASVLLLVPGVAVLNAQLDAIEGKPNLAAARGLRIAYLLLFMSFGLVLAQHLVVPNYESVRSPLAPPGFFRRHCGGWASACFSTARRGSWASALVPAPSR